MHHKTWGVLDDKTPFKHLFPDGTVPLKSIFPIIPKELGCPPCYLVDGTALDPGVINELVLLLRAANPDTKEVSDEDLKAYILKGLPLRTEWFSGCGTTDIDFLRKSVEPDLEENLYSSIDLN